MKITFKDYEQLTTPSTVNKLNTTKRAKELILLTERLTELGVSSPLTQLLFNHWHYNTMD